MGCTSSKENSQPNLPKVETFEKKDIDAPVQLEENMKPKSFIQVEELEIAQLESSTPLPQAPVELPIKPSTSDKDQHRNVPARRVSKELKEQSIRKIQRIARRAKAMKMAHAETQWKMFADLDTQDEAEMLHLAVFMQTLLENIPDDDKDDLDLIKKGQMEEDGMAIKLDNIKLAEKVIRAESSFRIDPNDFELGDGNITMEIVGDIIDIYKKRGRLSRKSVVKILRKVYKIFQKLPNVSKVEVHEGCKITMVGDLHGQLNDLLHILNEAGMPSPNNKYCFNGDFVDRGNQGLEVVVVLFALLIAAGPDVVCLNRGNHEDLPVCRVYGFEVECKTKYDDLLFEMFAEVFSYLPLFCLVNSAVFVVHGGLFHTPLVSIDDLEEIQRNDYYVKPQTPYPQCTHGMCPEDMRKEFMKQLQRDALWSDPTIEEGCYVNPRGAGVSFGPDIALVFMKHNRLSMVIRSHEMVFRGFDLPFAADERTALGIQPDDLTNPPNCPLLVTLFSASNYTDADNEGAFMTMMPHYFDGSVSAGKDSGLFYNVRRYKTSVASIALESSNKISLSELILKKKSSLMSAFEAADPNNLGIVSRSEWAEIMQRITLVKIRWLSIINKIAPVECLSPTSVAYKMFMQHFSLARRINSMQDMFKGSRDDTDGPGSPGAAGTSPDSPSKVDLMDDMYGQRKKLESIFYFFDTNGDGLISLEEFREGCEKLNKILPSDCQLTDIDRTLKMMDFDGSGTLDINEFFETFRILDAKDGEVDGVIGMATGRSSSVQNMRPSSVHSMRDMIRPASVRIMAPVNAAATGHN